MLQEKTDKQVVVIGGGPSGLTAAFELAKRQTDPIVLEKLDKVGGIARTENYKGYHFDMGGHRFYTKSDEVNQFWHEILGNDFLRRPRLSRIFYNNKYFNYPLKPFNALVGLGPIEGMLIGLSYLRWHLFPYKEEETFEQWVTNRFGKRLFNTFFKEYTEKVWGIPCSELKAEWAAQRIKDLSLKTAVLNMFFKPKDTIKTLIEEFDYPRQGPGMLWTAVKENVEDYGGHVCLNSNVIGINRNGSRITSVNILQEGERKTVPGTDFISSMPVTQFLQWLTPPPPPHVLEAAKQLSYRDFLTVCLVIDQKELFPDNWIYIHAPEVKVGRIQNYKNWSPEMVPDLGKTSLGLEYFCNEGDEIWSMADDELVELGKKELARIGLAAHADISDGCVFRVEKTYPVYDTDYEKCVETIKNYLATIENFQTIGRNGLHRYNNQDHAMLTGMYAVRNMMDGAQYDLWSVNAEQEYLEEIKTDEKIKPEDVVDVVQDKLGEVFPKLYPTGFGLSVGIVSGLLLFIATILIVAQQDGTVINSNLSLLNQFFPGYSVTLSGSFLGLLYGFASGFIAGWLFAFLRNAATAFYVANNYRSAQQGALRQFFDHM
ncbi:MAG: NAD(P)/FAD-dependent oxidoreductase [Chloroflexi bacterium]|nr:NAD(P)/FAD-dependent oxidoreductase [Chloroflexota bacterium]